MDSWLQRLVVRGPASDGAAFQKPAASPPWEREKTTGNGLYVSYAQPH